jgi:hypothetical protein
MQNVSIKEEDILELLKSIDVFLWEKYSMSLQSDYVSTAYQIMDIKNFIVKNINKQ